MAKQLEQRLEDLRELWQAEEQLETLQEQEERNALIRKIQEKGECWIDVGDQTFRDRETSRERAARQLEEQGLVEVELKEESEWDRDGYMEHSTYKLLRLKENPERPTKMAWWRDKGCREAERTEKQERREQRRAEQEAEINRVTQQIRATNLLETEDAGLETLKQRVADLKKRLN